MDKAKRYFFGSGITLEKEYIFSDKIKIRPIKFPTDHQKLEAYASDQISYGFLCALSHTLTFELEVIDDTEKDVAINHFNSQWLLILLSIVVRSPISFPIVSFESSLSLKDQCCRCHTIFVSHCNFSARKECTTDDLNVTRKFTERFHKLLGDKAFTHAASVAALNHNEIKEEIRMTAIWAAIEALIGVQHELSYRIPLVCSFF